MTDRNPIYLHKVDRILAPFLASISIMKGGNANYQDTLNLIFAGPGDYLGGTTYTLVIGMASMLMAYRDYVSGRFSKCVAQIWRKWIGNYDFPFAPKAKTRMSQPVNIHPAQYSTGEPNNQGSIHCISAHLA
jgi:hypothetical protein